MVVLSRVPVGRREERVQTVRNRSDRPSAPLVVMSRSCPPDVGGYQRQFSLLLPHLARERTVVAIGAVREPPTSSMGWEGATNLMLPAYRIPRRVRGVADLLILPLTALAGVVMRIVLRRRCALLVLSPGMPRWTWLVRFWARWIGGVVARFPTSGDAARLGQLDGLPCLGVVPGAEQLEEVTAVGLSGRLVPNAVELAPVSRHDDIVATVGRLVARKRVDVVVDGFAIANRQHPGWTLRIVGSGQSERDSVEDELRARVRADPAPVELVGEVPDPWAIAGDASVYVTASEREGSPNAVLEAMAHGLAIVAPSGAMGRWFDPVPPHRSFDGPGELGDVLVELLGDRAERGRLGAEAQEYVRRHHSVAGLVQQWSRIVDAAGRVPASGGWSRTVLPMAPDGLVLDVGSGRYPNPRADVLCEREPVRGDRRAVIDRPFVVADAAALPFRDRSFDLAIASHLVEHVDDPAAVLTEMSRVAASGYVETPHRRFERWLPEEGHRWAVEVHRGALRIEPNRWSTDASTPARRALLALYYAGERKSYATVRLPGPANVLVRSPARVLRGVLNRSRITTACYRFDHVHPPRVERR